MWVASVLFSWPDGLQHHSKDSPDMEKYRGANEDHSWWVMQEEGGLGRTTASTYYVKQKQFVVPTLHSTMHYTTHCTALYHSIMHYTKYCTEK